MDISRRSETARGMDQTVQGYGRFLIELAELLTLRMVLDLAVYFEFPNGRRDELQRATYPGTLMVENLRERGLISSTDISPLMKAFDDLKLVGIKQSAVSSFEFHLFGSPGKPLQDKSLQGKYSLLITALKEVYGEGYRGMKPLPFLHDTWYCVKDIFVESKMEVMNNTKSKEDPSRWSVINSRHEIFTEPSSGRRLTIEGEPGFGKSTLLLQYSYDWCTSSIESPLKDIDIFILIRLREVVDAPTISDAIRMMLPDDFSLTAKDIEAIITSGNWTVVLALDGYDEYSGMQGCFKDVTRLIQGRMLTACIVITTTRPSCLPKLLNPNMKLFRLTGFDREMQEEYLDKSFTFNAAAKGAKGAIMRKLEENVVLADICQVPFFFATFTHMACTSSNGMQLNSVTRYFSFMLACFFSHLENKELLGNRMPVHAVLEEDPNQRLAVAKLAFDGLIEQEQKLLWSQRNLEKYMGSSCYNRYVKAGVLVEEEHRIFQAIPGSHADDKIVITTYARFFHKTIQEYYAANHIAHLAENENAEVVKNTMSKFKLGDLQYVLRFACGLRPTAARLVQDYLGGLGEIGRMLSVLCLMEQQQGDIDKKVAELCRDRIRISIEESRILQRSKLQLLCTASHRNIYISQVLLSKCFKSVDQKGPSLCLFSGLRLPILDTLQELVIFFFCYDLRDSAEDILDYSAKCASLKILKFAILLLPQSFDGKDTLAKLRRKKCEVLWNCFNGKYEKFTWRLNLLSGKWENKDGRKMTNSDYREEARSLEIKL